MNILIEDNTFNKNKKMSIYLYVNIILKYNKYIPYKLYDIIFF
jgi:parallel beta-helix repeat protein